MVICYPQDGKRKSYDICAAFAAGCGGNVITDGRYRGGPAMFYGIDTANESVWRGVQASGEDWYYADNAYFDAVRGTYFRVGKNCLQHPGTGTSTGERFARLGLKIHPWRESGEHILVTPQSYHFMRVAVRYPGNWLNDILCKLPQLTNRTVITRVWNRDKKQLARDLPTALRGAWALVTFSSGSAISAILAGIPAISTSPDCIARRMCGPLVTVKAPWMIDREDWLNVVADQQWTLDEFRSGQTWRALQDVEELV